MKWFHLPRGSSIRAVGKPDQALGTNTAKIDGFGSGVDSENGLFVPASAQMYVNRTANYDTGGHQTDNFAHEKGTTI